MVTLWDWGEPTDYLHDEVATDRRNPTVNAYGKIYGATEDSTDLVPVLDPVTHTATQIRLTTRTPLKNPPGMFISQERDFPKLPSPFWGDKPLWGSHTTPHNPMFDHKGRVWFTSRIREAATPAFCRKGSDHPSAKLFPIERAGRQLSMYDPETGKLTLIDTCVTTHHLNFAEDENHTLWLSAGGFRSGYVGWLNVKMFDETGDEARSQGWSPIILDTNGNGKRDEGYVGPNDPVDPTKDKHILAALYAIAYNPVDKIDLGHGADLSRRHCAHRSRRQSAGDGAGGILRGAAAGLRSARRRYRSQRRLLGVARERSLRPLRSLKVQGPAQRSEGDRPALPGRLDALSACRGRSSRT